MGRLCLCVGLSLGDERGGNRSRYSDRVYGLWRPGCLLDELATGRSLGVAPASLCRGVDRKFDPARSFGGNAVANTRMSNRSARMFQHEKTVPSCVDDFRQCWRRMVAGVLPLSRARLVVFAVFIHFGSGAPWPVDLLIHGVVK